MRKFTGILLICFIISSLMSGCGVLQKLGIVKVDDEELTPASSIVMGEDDAVKLSDKIPVHIYFANEDFTKLRKEIRYVPVSEAKKSASALATLIVQELIKGPDPKGGLKATIPPEAMLRGPVTIEGGVATVDFTNEFKTKHPGGGKAVEQATIFSIVNSLTEMSEIQKVRFLINGKTSKEFLGDFQFDAPFPRTPSLISKEAPVNETVPTGVPTDPEEEEAGDIDAGAEDSGEAEDVLQDTLENDEETYIELESEEEILE